MANALSSRAMSRGWTTAGAGSHRQRPKGRSQYRTRRADRLHSRNLQQTDQDVCGMLWAPALQMPAATHYESAPDVVRAWIERWPEMTGMRPVQ